MIILGAILASALSALMGCQCGGDVERAEREPIVAPPGAVNVATLPPPTPKAAGTSVTIYIKIVMHKKYGLLAKLLAGKQDETWRSADYDPANPWWENPLVVYRDPPLLAVDAVGRVDAPVITGEGSSGNIRIRLSLTPHAEVAIRTIPSSDAIAGTLETNISTVGEFYDGGWVEMVRVADRKVTFEFDTRESDQQMEVISEETRTIPAFFFERYTREQQKWEPRSNWPTQEESGDWRVVVVAEQATLRVTRFRDAKAPDAEATSTARPSTSLQPKPE